LTPVRQDTHAGKLFGMTVDLSEPLVPSFIKEAIWGSFPTAIKGSMIPESAPSSPRTMTLGLFVSME
jgi:hypothetical protein